MHMPSSVIRSWRQDVLRLELEVIFASGRRYCYQAVPEAVANRLVAAESKGSYSSGTSATAFPSDGRAA
ncbi:KTSC domain-containing protein [Sphingomonas sp. TDK1]|uniref:KTSC domain-containing protein n=1 Tax=Sphingomonas sp. TDK1 TaxID=453247 RepID=UPI0007D8D371|nr:KTSC domain-containing protein [Sphingomonas sp. TDK1]OAN64023.1 hypothetical protein A7X12_18040 [Sphingomonas sp. TDK1]